MAATVGGALYKLSTELKPSHEGGVRRARTRARARAPPAPATT
jgi:hypothetical protein